MTSTQSNQVASVPGGPTPPSEAAALLDAMIRQLRGSRRRLEAQPILTQGARDALIYLETAEMHLKAARFRLAGSIGTPLCISRVV